MNQHLGKRERAARKRKKRNHGFAWSNTSGSGSLTLKLGSRKMKKINYQKLTGLPF